MCRQKLTFNVLTLLWGFLILLVSSSVSAETSEFWGNLKSGPFGIGFRTIEKYDFSRTFGSKYDYYGNPLPGEKARPIQVCIWYPAHVAADADLLTYAEYSYAYPEIENFMTVLSAIQNREIGLIRRFSGGNNGFVIDLFSRKVGAAKDAEPYDSTFPLIIYHPQFQTCISENAVMCEYLASYGFVVATSHPLGSADLTPGYDQAGMLTSIRDREFVEAVMLEWPQTDPDRIGLIGSASGGGSALLMQMRNNGIGAVAGLGGAYTETMLTDLIKQNAYFDVQHAAVPIMQLYPASQPPDDTLFFKSLRYAPRYSYAFSDLTPANFVHVDIIRKMVPDSAGYVGETRDRGYEAVCNRIYHFFNAILKDDKSSMSVIQNETPDISIKPDAYTFSYYEAAELPPTQAQFANILRTRGASEAIEIFDKFHKLDSTLVLINEETINYYGYQNLQMGQISEAVGLFRINAETFPQSTNVWDSYADGCIAAGDTARAIMCYEMVLKVMPGDTATDEQLKATLKTSAEQGLHRLKGE